MAIALHASIAKKVPIPGEQYASRQASLSIVGEVTDLAHILDEAHRLFGLAEIAVDAQLASMPPTSAIRSPATGQPVRRPAQSTPAAIPQMPSSSQSIPPSPPPPPPRSSRPFRRAVAAVTPSQLQLIQRLLGEGRGDLTAILHHYQLGGLDQLGCRDASVLIDILKNEPVR